MGDCFKFFRPFQNAWTLKHILKRKHFLKRKHVLPAERLTTVSCPLHVLKCHCPLEVLHLEKLEKIYFPGWKWYFGTKIVLTYCEKNSDSERSEQFLVTECFFNLFLEVSQTSYWGQENLKNITNSWLSASNLQNFVSTHFSWPNYPGKIQNCTR